MRPLFFYRDYWDKINRAVNGGRYGIKDYLMGRKPKMNDDDGYKKAMDSFK